MSITPHKRTIHITAKAWIVLHIMLHISGVKTQDDGDLIASISEDLSVKSVFLIYQHQNGDGNLNKIMNLRRTLNGFLRFYTSVMTFQDLQENISLLERGKVLIVVYLNPDTLESFVSVSKNIKLHRINWLWISSSTVLDAGIFKNVYIPFHTTFLYAYPEEEDFVIKEIYQKWENLTEMAINYGKWNKMSGLTTAEGEFYNRRRDLTGLRLKYLLKDGLETCDLSFESNPTVLECLNWEIWKDFEITFNFTSEYLSRAETSSMGHSATVMNKIENHEVDGGSWSFIITSKRLQQNNFMWPIVLTNFFMYTKVPEVKINFSSYLQPLSFNLWLSVLAWIITMGAIMTSTKWVIIRLLTGRNFLYLRDAVDDSAIPFSALCSQSADMKFGAEMITIRAFIMMSYIVSMFLLPAYSGGLISSLGNPPSRVPFTNIEEFAENGHYKIITLNNSFVHRFLQTESMFATVREAELTWPPQDMPTGDVQAFNLICERDLSYFIDQPVFLKDRPRCKLFTMNQLFGTFSLTMAVAKDFPFTELFKRILQRRRICGVSVKSLEKVVLNGLNIELELHLQKSLKGVFQESQFEHTKAFTLNDMLSIFIVFYVGLILSVIVLFAELCYHRKPRKRTALHQNKFRYRGNTFPSDNRCWW